MKRICILVIGVIILALGFTIAFAAQKKSEEKTKEELIEEAKEELNNTMWEITLMPMGTNKGAEKETDTLRFEDNRIASDKLVSAGFGPSNYTIRLKGKENEIVIWETMQTSEEEGVAFWRGEIRDETTMRGVLSWHVDEKDKRDYNFTSKETEIIIPESEPAEEEEIMPEVEPVTEVIEEEAEEATKEEIGVPEPEVKEPPKEEKKTKKRWWER